MTGAEYNQAADDLQHHAEMWALADDENMKHLLAWQRVKKRAEGGGFNGLLASDFQYAREALAALTVDMKAADGQDRADHG